MSDDPDLGRLSPGHVCKHGVCWPHPCGPCDDAAWAAREIDDDIDRDDEDDFDCHMGSGGHCGAAGSEDCEFECPYRREQRERAYARRKTDEPGPLL